MADEMTRDEFTEYMVAFERRLDARFAEIDTRFGKIDTRSAEVDTHFAKIDTRLDRLDTRFDDLQQSMRVQFEEVRRDIRLSFEATAGLREVTERGFSDMRAEHRDQTSLIHDVLRHARGRVETLERPGPKRKR